MKSKMLHPNTKTLLEAWDRMNAAPSETGHGPDTKDHPDLVDCLFVIEQCEDGVWAFRNAGLQLAKLLGRELAEHDYLDIWTGRDRELMASLMSAIHESRLPGALHARAETLTGQRIDIEMVLAPLTNVAPNGGAARMLGLYQTLGGAGLLQGRPVWRHRLTAVFPPDMASEHVGLRLVANNP